MRGGATLATVGEIGLEIAFEEGIDGKAGHAEGREALARFAAALENLPPVQREAFLLHEESGLTVAEIAAATGTNEEAAKSRLRYAMAKLKAAVEDG